MQAQSWANTRSKQFQDRGQTNPRGTKSDQEKQQILASNSPPPRKEANTCANVLISWAWGAGRAREEASRQQTYSQHQPRAIEGTCSYTIIIFSGKLPEVFP